MSESQNHPLQIIRPKQLAEILCISTTTLWRLEKKGELPPRIKITDKAVGWIREDIEQFIRSRDKANIYQEEEAEAI